MVLLSCNVNILAVILAAVAAVASAIAAVVSMVATIKFNNFQKKLGISEVGSEFRKSIAELEKTVGEFEVDIQKCFLFGDDDHEAIFDKILSSPESDKFMNLLNGVRTLSAFTNNTYNGYINIVLDYRRKWTEMRDVLYTFQCESAEFNHIKELHNKLKAKEGNHEMAVAVKSYNSRLLSYLVHPYNGKQNVSIYPNMRGFSKFFLKYYKRKDIADVIDSYLEASEKVITPIFQYPQSDSASNTRKKH